MLRPRQHQCLSMCSHHTSTAASRYILLDFLDQLSARQVQLRRVFFFSQLSFMAPTWPSSSVCFLALLLSTVRADNSQHPALLPAVHWDHDKANLQHLVPTDSHNLYYTSNGAAG